MADISEVLAFDCGINIIGILDLRKNEYTPYLYEEKMIRRANRIVSCTGTIVSFNGKIRDIMEIYKIPGFSSETDFHKDKEDYF